MTPIREIALSLPNTGDDEWAACRESFQSGWLTQGPQVARFELEFARRHQVEQALATSNCTTALHLILVAMGIGPGDEVIVPALTWVATANAVLYTGATPVFADIDPLTFNIQTGEIKKRLSPRTRAVIAVHLFGLCADVEAIRAELPSSVRLIEDAACAAGSSYQGRPAGGLADAAAFSFHPRKSITTGEGGMVTCNDAGLAETIAKLRNHGAEISEQQRLSGAQPYLMPEFNLLGYNYRMTDLQGAVGLVQLGKLDDFIAERRIWADWYRQQLDGLDWLRVPEAGDGYGHAWQAYVLQIDPARAGVDRNTIMERLQARGVATRPGTHAVHMLGLYRERLGLSPDDYPCARDAYLHSIAIPLHNRMDAADYQYVVDALKSSV